MIAGIGARSGVTPAEVEAAVDAALALHGKDRAALEALAVIAHKAQEAGIVAAATALGLRLLEADGDVSTPTCSQASLAATGHGSAAEAAALLGAGEGAVLLGPRLATGPVTCALAERRRA